MKLRLAVLVSGAGTNLQAIIDATLSKKISAEVTIVISNRPKAAALARARKHKIPTAVIDHTQFGTRKLFDDALGQKLATANVDLICLAGFMRILGSELVAQYPYKMINIHPSLLPQFPGGHAVSDALEAGVAKTGCTVHYVTADVDTGPVILQAKVPIQSKDTEATLAARIHRQEHIIYPQAIGLIAAGKVKIANGKVFIQGGVA